MFTSNMDKCSFIERLNKQLKILEIKNIYSSNKEDKIGDVIKNVHIILKPNLDEYKRNKIIDYLIKNENEFINFANKKGYFFYKHNLRENFICEKPLLAFLKGKNGIEHKKTHEIIDDIFSLDDFLFKKLKDNIVYTNILLKRLSIKNFKLINGYIEFNNINIIVGKNDTGKTSFLLAIYFYLKSLKALAKYISKELNEKDSNKIEKSDNISIYIDKDFFYPLAKTDKEETKNSLFFNGNNKRNIHLEGIIIINNEEIPISIAIGYKNRNFYLKIEGESLENLKKFYNVLKDFKFLYIPQTNVDFKDDITLFKIDNVEELFFENFRNFKYKEILKNLLAKFESNKLLKDTFHFLSPFSEIELKENGTRFFVIIKNKIDDKMFSNFIESAIQKTAKEFDKDWNLNNLLLSFLENFADVFKIEIDIKELKNLVDEILELNPDWKEEKVNIGFLRNKKDILSEYIKSWLKSKNLDFSTSEINDIGQGHREVMFIILTIILLDFLGKPAFLLIDEPLMFLHPKIKPKFVNFLQKNLIDKNINIQLFFSTHDAKIFPDENLYNINIIKLEKEKFSYPQNIQDIGELFSFLGSLGYMEFVIRNIEKLKNNKKILFVEGISDFNYLKILEEFNIKLNKLNLKEFAIFPIHSANNIELIPDILIGTIWFISPELNKKKNESIRNFINKELEVHILLDGDFFHIKEMIKLRKELIYDKLNSYFKYKKFDNLEISYEQIHIINGYSIENIFLTKKIIELLAIKKGIKQINEKINSIIEKNLNKFLESLEKKNEIEKSFLSINDFETLEKRLRLRDYNLTKYNIKEIVKNNLKNKPLQYLQGKIILKEIYNSENFEKQFQKDLVDLLYNDNTLIEDIKRNILKIFEI